MNHTLTLQPPNPAALPEPLIPIIQVKRYDQVQPAVRLRELYLFLGLNPSQYARWTKSNVIQSPYFQKGVDWIPYMSTRHDVENSEGQPAQDYVLCMEFAKHVAMMARTERGNQARNYFLECERLALEALKTAVTTPATVPDYPTSLRALADEIERNQQLEQESQELKTKLAIVEPQAALHVKLRDTDGTYDMLQVPRLLNLKDCGRTRLLELLRQHGVFMKKVNMPLQRWVEVDPPLFRVKESCFTDPEGNDHLSVTTRVTERGLEFLDRKLGEWGVKIKSD